jgi:LCP family protein required for cell wall assembly
VKGLARRLAVATGLFVAAGALALTGLVVAWVHGVRVPVASGETYLQITKLEAGRAATGEPTDGLLFVALIGNDYRPGVGGARGDALHLLGVNVAERQGTLIDFPRDLCWGGGKINAAHSSGGPRGQADALGQLAGVAVGYAVSVDFAGFVGLVDGVGGVEVDVLEPMDDVNSGAVFSTGVHRMDGGQALAYSRNRYDFASGDLQRTENQGHLIISALHQLQDEMDSPAGKFRLMSLLLRHAQLDGLDIGNVFHLGEVAFKIDPAAIRNVVVPVNYGGCEGGLTPSGAAGSLFADFADDAILQAH